VPRREKLFTPPFVMFTLSLLGVGFTFYLLAPTMAQYAVAEFGANETAAGFASSAFFLGAVAARPFAGAALIRFGVRRIVLVSLAGLFLSCLVYLLPATLASTIVIRVVHGIFFGLSQTALASAALIGAPASRRAEASGWFMLGLTVATGFAPFAGLSLVNLGVGQKVVFLVTIVCAAFALACPLFVARQMPGRPDPAAATSAGGLRSLVDVRALPIGAVVGLCSLAFATVLAFLNLFAAERGLTESANVYFLVYAVMILASRPAAGVLQDRYSNDVVMVPILVFSGLGMLLTAVATGPVVLLIAAALLGLGYGTAVSAGQAIAVSAVGHARLGLGVSSYFLVVDLGTGLGPVLLGPLVAPMGYSGALLVAAALPLLALLVYVLLARRIRPADPI
jgi:MFS family permease